jgi:hypothetical protein
MKLFVKGKLEHQIRRAYMRKKNSVPDTTHTRSLQLGKVYLQCKILSRFNEPLQPPILGMTRVNL